MQYRRFGRTGWQVSDIGYGMWGMGSWTGSDDDESFESLEIAVALGCNFFDTAHSYGNGRSERLLGRLVRNHPETRLYTATKLPPKNREWPARADALLDGVFPVDYIHDYAHRSLDHLSIAHIDLLQFHVWNDAWWEDERWQHALLELKREGVIRAAGISVNRWEPWNGLRTLRTGAIDAVQVIYNVFDQAPEDELFPLCRELDIGVIARVPFDEGTLTGTLTRESSWPRGDWRNTYFNEANLHASVARAAALAEVIPDGMAMPELALRFILSNPDVSTTIPGMRKAAHVRSNIGTSEAGPLPAPLIDMLRAHRWDRAPTAWSA